MDIKKIYQKGRDFSIKASIEIPKYLFGYGIHKSSTKQRQEIRKSEGNLGKRVLKLSLNYTWEGFREVVRYIPLALEGLILYEHITNNLPLSTWLYTSLPIRLIEGKLILEHRKSKKRKEFYKELNQTLEELSKTFEKLDSAFKRLNNAINNNPKFRAIWYGKLLSDPYSILGLSNSASEDEVKKAYRSIALECHPDRNNGGNEKKTKKFIEATKAYYQLTNQYHKL